MHTHKDRHTCVCNQGQKHRMACTYSPHARDSYQHECNYIREAITSNEKPLCSVETDWSLSRTCVAISGHNVDSATSFGVTGELQGLVLFLEKRAAFSKDRQEP